MSLCGPLCAYVGLPQRPTKNLNPKTKQPKLRGGGMKESVLCFTAQTVGICGPLWAYVMLCGSMCVSVCICGPLLGYGSLCWHVWASVCLCGELWASVSICEPRWASVGLCGPLGPVRMSKPSIAGVSSGSTRLVAKRI